VSDALPSALDHVDDLARRARGRPLAVFLDYDGTLSPIVERPELAVLDDATRATVASLAARCPVAVVSGRDRHDVQARVGLSTIAYAGSHGFDIALADGARHEHPAGQERLAALDRAEAALRAALAGVDGALVERKRYSIATHFRLVADADLPRVERAVGAALAPGLRRKEGKKVVELQPDVPWDKGAAVRWLLDALALGPDALPLYVGDDVTDEDAFRAVRDDGLGVVVLDRPRATAATLSLRDPGQVRELLDQLAAALGA
jgi:trehalose-phosphatase